MLLENMHYLLSSNLEIFAQIMSDRLICIVDKACFIFPTWSPRFLLTLL